MPTKGAYTLERLQAFGAAAAENARARLSSDGERPCEQLACEYRGIATDTEEYVTNELPTLRSTIAYEWHVSVGVHHEQTVVLVRCGNASERGVPFPKTWHTALRCANLEDIANEAGKAARNEVGGDITCKVLGVCKKASLPEPGEQQPGATVLLSGDGPRMAHLLCAHIDGDTWLCHRGSFDEHGKLNDTDPLNYHDLVALSNLSR